MALITIESVLMGRAKLSELPKDVQENIKTLVSRINQLFDGYSWPKTLPRVVNSGYRRPQDQPKNAAQSSPHLIGCAVDLDDDDSGITWKYVFKNLTKTKQIGLWIEDPRWTHGSVGSWVHLQIIPPKSGKRIFIPSTTPAAAPNFWDGKYDKSLDGF